LREIVIYTDESEKDGKYFGNFYGGAAVCSKHLNEVIGRLKAAKDAQGLTRELKWQKVTPLYLEKYIAFVQEYFTLANEGKVRTRIMFTHNYRVATNLNSYQRQNEYHLLYYQFLKHAFGLQYAGNDFADTKIRLYLDKLPDNKERNSAFKGYVHGLEAYRPFRRARIRLPVDQMAEVDSSEHVILQGLDVVLGSMQFRLNDKHLQKIAGATRRGKKTIAKEKLYRVINGEIRKLYPNFNIGISTGNGADITNRWNHAYRHWRFTPAISSIDSSKAKPK
jgi:hypothetical protein